MRTKMFNLELTIKWLHMWLFVFGEVKGAKSSHKVVAPCSQTEKGTPPIAHWIDALSCRPATPDTNTNQLEAAMTRHISARVIFIFCLSGYSLASRKLLVFLIDGFRYDYIDDLEAFPGFKEIVENGVKVDYLTPDFPSLSYPNYYSLMTGETFTYI